MPVLSLLIPRFIQLGDFPTALQKPGTIFLTDDMSRRDARPAFWYRKYPLLFRELKWYEHRKLEELPEYLTLLTLKGPNRYYKVKKYFMDCDDVPPYAIAEDGITSIYLRMSVPITKEEYEAHLGLS